MERFSRWRCGGLQKIFKPWRISVFQILLPDHLTCVFTGLTLKTLRSFSNWLTPQQILLSICLPKF